MSDRTQAPGNEIKDESAPDLNTPGFEPVTQWSEVECSTAWWSAARPQILKFRNCVTTRHAKNLALKSTVTNTELKYTAKK